MRHDKMMSPIIAGLPSQAESDHYTVFFGYRDPAARRSGLGIHGVRNPTLINVYLEALERLYQAMTGPVFRRPAPRVDDSGRTPVYVFNIADRFASNSPFMMVDQDGIPYLGLPCRSADPTLQAAFHRAASEAVHEATHAFNWSARLYQGGLWQEGWHWFNEATAVFMERCLLAGNPDAIRFCLDWTDMPERPLDNRAGMYEAGMFATYLATRFRHGLISDLWTQSTRTETPFDTLNRLMQTECPELHTTEPALCPVFAEYCLDSYFLWDYQSKGFALDVYIRFGKRALADCAALAPGGSHIFKNTADHLGCRYQRIELASGVRRLRLQATLSSGSAGRLDIRAAVVTKDMKRGSVVHLVPVETPGPPETVCLVAELDPINPAATDNVVLMVANCGARAAVSNPDVPHDDGREYTIEVEAT